MTWALDEFFSSVEEEFGVSIPEVSREMLATPGLVVDYLVEHSDAASELDEEDRRDHLSSVLGELIAQSLGITRYRDDSRFVEDMKVR